MTQQRSKGPGSAGGPSKETLGADDDTFGYLRTHQIPAYGSLSNTANMNDNPYLAPAGNYYPFAYGLGDGNTAWSSGGEPMFSFGNYGHGNLGHGSLGHGSHLAAAAGHQTNDHHHSNMYGAGPSAADFGSNFGYGSHPPAAPGFSYFPSAAGEYEPWGTGGRTNKAYEDYYRTSNAQHSLGGLTASMPSSSNSMPGFDYPTVNGDAGFGVSGGGQAMHDVGLKGLDQTMGGLSIGGDKGDGLPLGGGGGAGSTGDGSMGGLSPKDLFSQRNMVGGDHMAGGGNGVPSIGGGGLPSPHSLMGAAPSTGQASVGIAGGPDGSIPPGPGGLGTSGGVGGLITSGGGGTHPSNAVTSGPVSPQQQQQQASPPQKPAPQPAAPSVRSWANIASQPAKPQPKVIKAKNIPPTPVLSANPRNTAANMDIGTWGESGSGGQGPSGGGDRAAKDPKPSSGTGGGAGGQPRNAWGNQGPARQGRSDAPAAAPKNNNRDGTGNLNMASPPSTAKAGGGVNSGEVFPPVLKELMGTHKYNPRDYNLNPKNARFFVIKSYSEDDIHRSIKYGIWCSTEHGNKRLDDAFKSQEGKGPVLLFYSVNGSGHFCGMAQMMGPVDYDNSSRVWLQDKWKGQFGVKWIYVKDVPNTQLRHIRLENNENKPVTNSRDTQEILGEKGKLVLKILHQYKHSTSIFDDFGHYEKRQETETFREGDPKPGGAPNQRK